MGMFNSLPDAPNKREREQAAGGYEGMFAELPDLPTEQSKPVKPVRNVSGVGGVSPMLESGAAGRFAGDLATGFMDVARSLMRLPKHLVKAAVAIEPQIAAEGQPQVKSAQRAAKITNKLIEEHSAGVQSIINAHPEWATSPPKNFVDLATDPGKLAHAITRAAPLMISAGILTAAGQPGLGATMMFATEGQQAHDQAKDDGATDEEAEQAYFLYGSVAAVIEQAQLSQVMKLGKMGYQQVLNRSAQKLASAGTKSFKKQFIKTVVNEAIEEAAQGTWGEVTAKLVYDKSIEGGIAGFIDRRAQEALLGGSMALLAGGGGIVAGRMTSDLAKSANIEPEAAAAVVRSGMEAVDTEAPVEEQTRQFTEAAEQAFEVERKISRFPGKVTDAASLKKIGVAMAKEFGADVDGAKWIFKTKQSEGVNAEVKSIHESGKIVSITIRVGKGRATAERDVSKTGQWAGSKPGRMISATQSDIKRVILHELGHRGVPYKISESGRILAHHKEFKAWVNDNVPKLLGTVKVKEGEPRSTALANMVNMAPKPREYQVIEFTVGGKEVGPVQEKFKDEAEAKAFAETMTESSFTPGMFEVRMAAKPVAKEATADEVKEEHEQTLEELAEALDKRQTKIDTPIEKLNRGGVFKVIHSLKSLGSNLYQNFMRVERMLEALDGHKEGTFYNKIWRPLKAADEFAVETTNNGMEEFVYRLEGQGIDTAVWLGKVDEVGPSKIRLTASQRIGIYTLSKNENGMRYLTEGMGFTKEDLEAVMEFMDSSEKTVAEWLLDQYEAQWPTLKAAAIASGINPKVLKKEFKYSPILRTDASLEQQDDFLAGLADQYTRDSFSPEKKMLEERQEGAVGEIELDSFVMYMHNIARTERFKAMAPVTAKIGKIINDRGFKRQLNAATYGHGSKILSTWLKDTVRGTSSAANTLFQKGVAIARRNGVVYAIGYNLPSSLRQTLSMSNAVATDPLMLKYTPMNITKAMTPKGYTAIEQFVYNRSTLVKTRSFERDLRQKWNKSNLSKRLRGKADWSQTATAWIKWMDRHTTVVAWKSLYDTAMEKFDGNETKAEQYADKWIGRTQPMANTKDLPQFFRGSQLEKLLTTFQNQINQNGNFYAHDIIGARKAGEIGNKVMAHRIMFSYIMPAMLFGMIGRARLPLSWRDVLTDLATYPIAPLLLVGRWVDRMIRGWGQSGTVAESGPESLIKAVESAKKGDFRGIMFNSAKAVGAFTGRIPAQAIRTTEGALDLLAGSTQDPRRLVYSKWALEQGKQKGQPSGRRGTKRKRPRRRKRRSR